MPSQPPIPPLLSPYLCGSPSDSLTLLTSTLGASTNWLVLRFVYAALKRLSSERDDDEQENFEETRVVLVSWLRDANFWREGGRKLGINFQNVTILDALSTGLGLGDGGLAGVESLIVKAITAAKEATKGEEHVLLVLDGLDFLLAATGCPTLQTLDLIGSLREHVHTTLLTSCADLAFTQSQSTSTPLEVSQAAFVMSMAHQARMVLSVRGLDTGVARDVSGVLRVSRGSGNLEQEGEEKVEERECLYFVGGDGVVRVSERGG